MLGRSHWSKDVFAGDQFPSFTKLLNEDRYMKAGFHAGMFALVVLAGRGDDKNTTKGIEHLYRTSSVPDGLLRTGVRLGQAIELLAADMKPLQDFFRTLWSAGWDLSAQGFDVKKLDEDVAQAILCEGLVLDYLLQPEMRAQIRPFAEAMRDTLKETNTWRKGREILSGLTMEQLNSFALARHPDLRDYAAMVIMAVKVARNELVTRLVDEEHLSQTGGCSFSGPTAWTMSAVQTILFREFFGDIDSIEKPKTLKMVSDLLDNFKFSDCYLSQRFDFLKQNYLWARKGLVAMHDAQRLLAQQASLAHSLEISEILDRLPPSNEGARVYLHAPPAYFVRYCSVVDDGSGDTGILHMTNSIATSHVSKAAHEHLSVSDLFGRERPSSDFVTWCVSTDGHLRSSFSSHAIPLIGRDLGLDDEAFGQVERSLEERTMRQVQQLGTVWERYPGLYCASLNFHSGILILESGPEISFHVIREDKETLKSALLRSTRDMPADRYTIAESESKATFGVTITRQPEPPTTTPVPQQPKTKRAEAEVSREFVSSYCPQFRDLARILSPFGVTIASGKGSHQKLLRDGHMTVISKNQRDGTLLLNEAVVLQVLERLHINEEEFVRRTRKEPPQG